MAAQASQPSRGLALITGGGSGIGYALAKRIIALGHRTIIVGRNPHTLRDAVARLGPLASSERLDVSDADAVAAFCTRFRREYPSLDLLVNNAGVPARQDALSASAQSVREVMATNLHGMVDMTLGLWPSLACANGRVVNVVSVAGAVATSYDAPYATSKHAALGWSRALSAVSHRDGVHVLTVNPGPVVTPGFPQTHLTGKWFTRPFVIDVDRCANRIMTALGRRRGEVFIPRYWVVPAVLGDLIPGLVAGVSRIVWTGGSR